MKRKQVRVRCENNQLIDIRKQEYESLTTSHYLLRPTHLENATSA